MEEFLRWRAKRPMLYPTLGAMPAECARAFEFLVGAFGESSPSGAASSRHDALVAQQAAMIRMTE